MEEDDSVYVRATNNGFAQYFSDGSTPHRLDGEFARGDSGFACVRQRVGTSYGRSMQGRCQNTGNNYPVECLGVLAAFLDARADEDVCVAEDCLANVQALYKRGDWRSFGSTDIPVGRLTHRERIRSGARAINNTIRTIIATRHALGSCSRVRHVRAHTGGMDVDSTLNDRADKLAKTARSTQAGSREPFTDNEERAIFFAPLHGVDGPHTYISGDLRKTLKRVIKAEQQRNWAACEGAQGLFPKQCQSDIQEYCGWLNRVRNPQLVAFAVMSALRSLPTPHRYARRRSESVRNMTAMCPLCSGGITGDTDHALGCQIVVGVRQGVESMIDDELSRCGIPSGREIYDNQVRLPPTCLYWYTAHRVRVNVKRGVAAEVAEALVEQHRFDKTSGILGAQPKYLQRALHHFLPNFNEQRLNRLRSRLRTLALTGAMNTYKEYLRGIRSWAKNAEHADRKRRILGVTDGSPLSEQLLKAWGVADTAWIGPARDNTWRPTD